MAGLNSILEMGKRSLSANQFGINVTSHNITNAASPGYSRQRLMVVPSAPEKLTFGYVGTGVTIQSVQRMRENYIGQQTYAVNQNNGRAMQRQSVLSLAESYLQEPSDTGLSAMMQEFFASFQSLSLHPEESANRNAVVQRAQLMTGAFHRIAESFDSLRNDMVNQAETMTGKINMLVSSIAGLDRTIVASSASGTPPNDLLDRRDESLNELSKLVDINVSYNTNGSVSVAVGGSMLVTGGTATEIDTSYAGGVLQMVMKGTGNTIKVSGGTLGAVISQQNVTLTSYAAKFDQLAAALIDSVNTAHAAGYGLGTPPATGTPFFTGSDASTIDVAPAVVATPSLVAASGTGAPGDNSVALAIANLQSANLLNGGTVTAAQFYAGVVSTLGSEIEAAVTEADATALVAEQLTTQQNAVSGVSLDEEMTNLIKYQHGFDAAARVVTAVNEMFQTILSM